MPAKSESQRKAAGAALAAKRGGRPTSSLMGASRSMAKMSQRQLKHYASKPRTTREVAGLGSSKKAGRRRTSTNDKDTAPRRRK